jgi:hypothetical protein
VTIRTEQGDPVRAAQAADLGAIVTDRAGEQDWTAQAVAQTADLAPYAVVDNHLPLMRRQAQRRVSNLDTRTSPGRRTLELLAQLERDLHAYQARGRTHIVTDGAS